MVNEGSFCERGADRDYLLDHRRGRAEGQYPVLLAIYYAGAMERIPVERRSNPA